MVLKLLSLIGLVVVAVALSGAFGMLHNQISCTVGPEYFTRFKYIQFAIPDTVPLRLGAAIVGFLATWWMGLFIGPLMAFTALRFPDLRRMWKETLTTYGIVLGITGLFSLLGLMISFQLFPVTATPSSGFGAYSDVSDIAAFNRAGTMHNSSYFGGIVGAFLGWVRMMHCLRQEKVTEK